MKQQDALDIPELINRIYGRGDGMQAYAIANSRILKANKKSIGESGNLASFLDRYLIQCMPAAAIINMSLEDLVSLAVDLVTIDQKYGILNYDENIAFVHRSLLRCSTRLTTQ